MILCEFRLWFSRTQRFIVNRQWVEDTARRHLLARCGQLAPPLWCLGATPHRKSRVSGETEEAFRTMGRDFQLYAAINSVP